MVDPPEPGAAFVGPGRARRVIVAHGSAASRAFFRLALESTGHDVAEAAGASALLGLLEGDTPDAVLLGPLPTDTGASTIVDALWRQWPALHVIAVEPSLVEELAVNGREVGSLPYPPSPDDVRRGVALRLKTVATDVGAPVPRVVVVAHGLAGAQALAGALQDEGCEVALVETGTDALTEVHRCAPDLVVLATVGPGPSGFEDCWELRRTAEDVPVVLLSPFDDNDDDRAGARQVGASGIVPLMRPMATLVDDVLGLVDQPVPRRALGASPVAEAAAHLRRHRADSPIADAHIDTGVGQRARIAILEELIDGLVNGRDPADLLGEMLARVLQLVAGSRGAVHLVDDAGNWTVEASVGYPDDQVPPLFRHLTMASRAVARAETVVAVGGDGELDEVLVANGSRSMAAVPLRASQQHLGAFVIGCPHRNLPVWRDLLTSIGEQVGLVVRLGLTVEQLAVYDRLNQHRLRHDAATGLANDVLLTEWQTSLAGAETGTAGALVLIGLDRFEALSRSYGPQVADSVLRDAAARLSELLPATRLLARIGQSEFAVLLPEVDGRQAKVLAGLLVAAFDEPIACGDTSLYVTANVGISLFPDHGHDMSTLRQRANLALQRARTVKERVDVYAAAWDEGAPTRMTVEQALRAALRAPAPNGLRLHYQPLVELPSRQVRGIEALLRWVDPRLGAVSPAQVLPVAEEAGLMTALGHWVLRTACQQAASLQAHWPSVELAVNIDAAEVAAGDLMQRVAAALAESGLPPEQLRVEITETAAMLELDRSAEILQGVRSLGVKIALDDFGTGYSSLALLQRLPIDQVKIDRSFVNDVGSDRHAAEIVGAVIDLSHRLGLTALAEGVETEEQAAVLIELGCDEAQGYLFSPALPAEEVGMAGHGVIVLTG